VSSGVFLCRRIVRPEGGSDVGARDDARIGKTTMRSEQAMTISTTIDTCTNGRESRKQMLVPLCGLALALAVASVIGARYLNGQGDATSASSGGTPNHLTEPAGAVLSTSVSDPLAYQHWQQQVVAQARQRTIYYLVGSTIEADAVLRAVAVRENHEEVARAGSPNLAVVLIAGSAEEEATIRQAIANDTYLRLAAGQEPPQVVDLRANAGGVGE
jgi:hypothetical protein